MPNPTLYDNFNQVRQYIDKNQVDLSSYVSKSELAACSYVTSYTLNSYLTVPPSIVSNPTVPYTVYRQGLSSNDQYHFIYPNAISYTNTISTDANAWASVGTVRNYVNGRIADIEASYVTSSDLPVIDENIIPKETGTYTLGDSSHIYSNTYSRGVYLGTGIRMFSESSASSNDMAISLGGVPYFYLNTNRFAPNGAANNEKLDLGTADRKWNHIYGKSVDVDTTYTDTAYLKDTSYSSNIIPKETNTYTLGDSSYMYNATYTNTIKFSSTNSITNINTGQLTMKLNNSNTFIFHKDFFAPNTSNVKNLGTSNLKWAATYTSNLYADNIHNFIWTGTSAEYAALSDYTTYQIYMIKEA